MFNIALEGVMRRGGFASQMIIVGITFHTEAELHIRLNHEATKVGLVVNALKTKYMLIDGTERDRVQLGSERCYDSREYVRGSRIVCRKHIIWAYYGQYRTKCAMSKTLIKPVVLYGYKI